MASPRIEFTAPDLSPRSSWRVCVTGGRDYTNRFIVWVGLNTFDELLGPIEELAHGGARGVDKLCGDWAMSAGLIPEVFEADWDRHGEEAGGIRNGEMLETFKPDALIVFPGGTGTSNCTRQARKLEIPRVFINPVLSLEEQIAAWA